jgi:hypothetical protein
MNLKKVDFVWINRDQRSFEWFVNLLLKLESEQLNLPENERILEFHMYITSISDETKIKSLFLQLALKMMQEKTQRNFITGLRQNIHSGRPDWDKV